jgi:hypothetical protein
VALNEISIPLELRKDWDRLHFTATVAPTLNILNSELSTEIWDSSLSNLQAQKVSGNYGFEKRQYFSGDLNAEGGGEVTSTGSSAGSLASSNAVPPKTEPTTTTGGGGKGANFKQPRVPGERLNDRLISESSTDFAWGLKAQVGLQLDLDDADRWFVEVWGGYNFMQGVTVSNEVTSVELDGSSWTAGAGLGYRW